MLFGVLATALVVSLRAVHADECASSSNVPVMRITVEPQELWLRSPRSRAQLIVTGYRADGSIVDLTHAARFECGDIRVSTVDAAGTVHPVQDGRTSVRVDYDGLHTTTEVTVSGQHAVEPVRFHAEVLAILTKQGCNAGSCHGSPHGKNGFHLSLLAYAPEIDAEALIFDGYARRINRLNPDESLLLKKPTLKIPHGGHKRLREGTPPYAILRQWIVEGAGEDGPDEPACTGIELTPRERRELRAPHLSQQLAVHARFSDGSNRDVTHLAKFESSHDDVARVDETGLVTGGERGEAAVSVRYLDFIQPFPVTVVHDGAGFVWTAPAEHNGIDRHVNNKLRQLKFLPSETCPDEDFVRRVFLDVIGLLPTVEETRRFLADSSMDKRSALIDSLLKRPEHARFWAQKAADVMRVNAAAMKDGRAERFSRWLAQTIGENMPFDRFTETLLTAAGDTLEQPPANYFVALPTMEDCAEATAQIFMGSRVQCAKCHNHPFENWTQDDYYSLAAVFARVDAKPARVTIASKGEAKQPSTGEVMRPWGMIEHPVAATGGDSIDRREAFATWLTAAENPYFARVEVNRIWSHLFGRGIVEPVDDFRLSNPPANGELLDFLAAEFVHSGYDRQHILRTILNCQTYQRSAVPAAGSETEEHWFSHARIRLLSAEQLHDAIGRVTGTLLPHEQAIAGRITQATAELDTLVARLGREQPQWEAATLVVLSEVPRMAGHWFSIGPLPVEDAEHESGNARRIEELPVDFREEFHRDPGATDRWQIHPEWVDGRNVVLGGKGEVHYLSRRIAARATQPVEVRLRSPNAITLWVNGREVFPREAVRSPKSPDQEVFVTFELEPGTNTLLLQLRSEEGPNSFRFDLAEPGVLQQVNPVDEQILFAKRLFYGDPDDGGTSASIPHPIGVILKTPAETRTEAERDLLIVYYHSTQPQMALLRDEIVRLEGRLDFATQRAVPDSDEFLRAFGKPDRETSCVCERAEKPTLLQALQLLNGPLVHRRVQAGARRYRELGDDRLVETLYLAALSRLPTEDERRTATAYLDGAEQRDAAVEDLLWAVINTRDFLFQH